MNLNRRDFIKATAIAAACSKSEGADPFAPADTDDFARWFDKNRQHVLPGWAFTSPLGPPPPTPMPTVTETWDRLKTRNNTNPVKPFLTLGDEKPLGHVFHGIAAEWDGNIAGGDGTIEAWKTMKNRVMPQDPAYGISDLGNWGKFGDKIRCYKITTREVLKTLRRDAAGPALLYSYDGMVPGPTFRFRHGMPAVVRFQNELQTEISVHHHGGHTPSHSDGFPSFYVLQSEARDYLYPNILPLRQDGMNAVLDFGEGQSTTWYHDHGLDATAFNVSHGLAGFALWFDELELRLIREGVLPGFGMIASEKGGQIVIESPSLSGYDPDIESADLDKCWAAWKKQSPDSPWAKRHTLAKAGAVDPEEAPEVDRKRYYRDALVPYFNPYDVPLVLQDRVISLATGQIVYDSNGHNGYIGNTQLVNGVAWPTLRVKRRRYRFRVLDGSNARIYRLRFLDGATFRLEADAQGNVAPAPINEAGLDAASMEFFRIGKDSWLWPTPQRRKSVLLNMANRADLILDFGAWFQHAERSGRLNRDREAEFFMVNTMPQFDGRGPKSKLAEDAGDPQVFPIPFNLNPANRIVAAMQATGEIPAGLFGGGPTGQLTELAQPIGLMRIIIEDDPGEGADSPNWRGESTVLRPRHMIENEDVMAVREFIFSRGKGAWMINDRFYDPTISNANPIVGIKGQKFRVPDGSDTPTEKQSLTYAEEWILTNGGGGWWHPIHIHLEGHQLIGYEKDFAADLALNAAGFPAEGAAPKRTALPGWGKMVGPYGLDPIIAAHPEAAKELGIIRQLLLLPQASQLAAPSLAWQVPLLEIILHGEMTEEYRKADGSVAVVRFKRGAAALLDRIQTSDTFSNANRALRANVRQMVDQLLKDLAELALQWVGDVTGNHDTQALGPNTVARIRMRFRTYTGPVVFHCHNVEHEDMRMMVNFEATLEEKEGVNVHDPNVAPNRRTHGQTVTDLNTNPSATGEIPWGKIPGFNQWEEAPIPYTPVDQAGKPIIEPR